MNIVQVLVDRYEMTFAEIASQIGSSEMAVRRWYGGEIDPDKALPIYRRGLTALAEKKKAEKKVGA